jgi:hypothetical protein
MTASVADYAPVVSTVTFSSPILCLRETAGESEPRTPHASRAHSGLRSVSE